MSSLKENDDFKKTKLSLNKQTVSNNDDSDDLDSLLDRLQNLSFDSTEIVKDKKPEVENE